MEEFFGNLFYESTLRIGRVVTECIAFMRTRDIEHRLGTSDRDIHETTFFLEGCTIDE